MRVTAILIILSLLALRRGVTLPGATALYEQTKGCNLLFVVSCQLGVTAEAGRQSFGKGQALKECKPTLPQRVTKREGAHPPSLCPHDSILFRRGQMSKSKIKPAQPFAEEGVHGFQYRRRRVNRLFSLANSTEAR